MWSEANRGANLSLSSQEEDQDHFLPVDFPVETIAPEDAVVGYVQVQSDGVLLRGHHLAVVPLHQVDTSDLVPVGEEQVRAFTCSGSSRDATGELGCESVSRSAPCKKIHYLTECNTGPSHHRWLTW